MSKTRRILVIGSQCEQLGKLTFLPDRARELYQVMRDPQLGDCAPAIDWGLPEEEHCPGLLLDPKVEETRRALIDAFTEADKGSAYLFLAFVGHGMKLWHDDLYLLPTDAPIDPYSHTAIHAAQFTKELLGYHSGIAGLVMIIDACHSGAAVTSAARLWPEAIEGIGRFEVLAAVEADKTAADGAFSRTLIEVLKSGLSDRGSRLLCQDILPRLHQALPNQLAQYILVNSGQADEALYLAQNAKLRLDVKRWPGERTWAEIERLTRSFQSTPQLDQVVTEAGKHRCLALVGATGSGKSCLAAALVAPHIEGVPQRFVQAAVFLSETTGADDMADILSEQLIFSPGFEGFLSAHREFGRNLTEGERRRLASLDREVVGPLAGVGRQDGQPWRILVDGLDRTPGVERELVYDALDRLAGDDTLAHVQLLVTARPKARLPAGAKRLKLGTVDDASVRSYLKRLGVRRELHRTIVDGCGGNWLEAAAMAQLALAEPGISAAKLAVSRGFKDYLGIQDRESRRAEIFDRALSGMLGARGGE